jgi:hypothetical protein
MATLADTAAVLAGTDRQTAMIRTLLAADYSANDIAALLGGNRAAALAKNPCGQGGWRLRQPRRIQMKIKGLIEMPGERIRLSHLVFYGSTADDLPRGIRWFVFMGGRRRRAAMRAAGQCWSFSGPCTGFGKRQCVTAPAAQEPDAGMVEHCCEGWFQYPWIEVCPDQPARMGCGFCWW